MAVIVATRANYWISSTALSITLNALGEPNRIQASVASGAVIMCYIRGVEGLDFDNGHNYRRWPLTISPTYFNSNTEKYLYVAIPRSNTIGSDAMVVFPSQKIDIYGYAVVEDPETHEQTQGEQIGTDDYYYIWLQGIITSSGESGSTPRDWSQRPDYGILRTDEATDSTETNWYRWDPITQTVTFLKDIWMEAASAFNNLRVKKMIFNGHELNGVAVKDVTPSDSDDTIVTPAYLDGLTDGKYIRKDQDDRTDFSLGVGGNLTVDGDATVDGTLFANQSVRTDEVRSSNYTGDTIADTGYLLTAGLTNGLGHSKLTIDEIYVRMKATFESLEVRKWSVVAGDEIRSCAANVINRVDYFTDTGELLGYTEKRVPWLMKRVPFLLKLFGNVQSQWGRYLYSKIVRMRVTLSNDDVARIAYCRCYFLADDGDTTIENWWQRDDLVRCQTMNITSTIRNTYTNIQRKAGNVFWWRKCIRVSANGVAPSENPDNVRCQPAIIDEKTYHWFDVVFNGAIEYDPVTGQMTGRTDGNFMVNSDLPAAGDHAIQFGNTTIPGRMNLWITMVNGGSTRDYDPDGDAPCIKGFTGIYTFDLNKCFTGGNPCKMTLAPGKKYHFYGREFRVIKEYGEVPMPTQRGAWLELPLELDENNNQLTYPDDIYNDQGAFVSRGGYILVNGVKRYGSAENPIPRTYARKCYWYDEVTHKSGTWLCSITEGSHWVADVAFTDDATGRSFTAGQIVPPGIYSALSTLSKAKCSSHENYTTDEPSGISASWTNLTKGVTTMETRYRKKARLKYNSTLQKYEVDPDAGIIPPAEPWAQWYTLQQWEAIQRSGTEPSPENQIMQDGDYMWSCTMTEFSSDNPVFEYKVMRWGIDSDGLKINSYFLGLSNTSIIITPANDNYKMPGDSGWDAAAPQGKWWDTFDAMAAANGGVGAMQGWNVWTKTVVHYDLAENKSPDEQKPDLVQYTCSRIGQDGQIAQEEYYMLAESDDFATVFGNPAQAASYYYAKTGIRWYTEDTPKTTDLPEAERYRLSPNTPNICTKASEQTTAATPIWSPIRPKYDNSTAAKAAKKFLWNFEYRVDGQGTPYATKPICIGDHSRGIVGVRELYALSQYGHAASGQDYPSDVRSGSAQEQQTDKRVWTDEIYDRAPTEALPYQWNWTRTLYTNPLNDSDTARDAATGYPYEDHYHVSSVRGTKGEDGAGMEYVYCRPQSHDANGNPITVTLPDPNILKDAGGTARTRDYIKQTDDFIPYQYTDNPVGIDFQHQVEYQCERKSTAVSGTGGFTGGHEWRLFSQPKVWSKWGKNGMDGDGTEYVFIRTKNNVAPVLLSNDGGTASQYQSNEWRPYVDGTGRTDIETNDGTTAKPRCSDDPKGCTRDWPYEWIAKRTMATPDAESGKRVWKSYYASVGSPYKMSPWSNYAENAMRLDLSNEMDMVQTDSTGKITAARTVTTVVTVFDGAKVTKDAELNDNVNTLAIGTKANGTANKPTITKNSDGTWTITWTFAVGDTVNPTNPVDIDVLFLNVPYTAEFTLAASMGQPIYQLHPTLNSINFTRKPNNTLEPSSTQLGLKILKIDANSTTEMASAPSGYTVRYSTASMPASKTAGTVWGTNDGTTGITWSGSVMTIASSVTIGDVFIALFFGDVIIDRETIPVLKDGENGDGISSIVRTYAISNVSKTANDSTEPAHQGSWSASSPAVTEQYPYLWAKEVVTYKYASGTTKYYCIGARGDNGVDAKDVEWVYVRTTTNTPPTIVAESGDGYKADDYLPLAKVSSGRIKGATEADANTSVRCTDDPQGVNDTWKYEWEIKREKGTADANGHRIWKAYSGTMTLHNNLAESSFVIDIDNDNDQFGTDSTSKVLVQQIRETNVTMLYGTQEQNFSAAPTASLKYDDGTSVATDVATVGVTKVTDSKYKVTVTIKATPSSTTTMPFASHNGLYVDISGTCAKGGPLSIRFTLEKVMGGAPGVNPTIYQIALSQKSLSYGRDASNNLVAKSNSVTVNVKKTVGNDSTIYTSTFTGAPTISWGYDDSTTAQEAGKAVGYTITLAPASVGTHKKIWIKLTTGDKEEVPIVTDGTNGSSPWIADLDNEMDSVSCDDRGHPVKQQVLKTKLSFNYGSAKKNFKITGITKNGSSTMGTGVTLNVTPSSSTIYSSPKELTVTYDTTATISGKDDFAITMVAADDASATQTLHFTVNGVIGDVYNLLPWDDEIIAKYDGTTYKVNGSTSYALKCGYTKNVDGAVTTVKEVTDGIVDGKYYIFYRVRRRSDKRWQCWESTTQTSNWDDEGGTNYPLYSRLKNGTTSVDINLYDAFEIVLTANGSGNTGGYATANIQAIDRETVYVVSDGADGKTPTISISTGEPKTWIINGIDTHIVAEGKDGTGVEIKGSVATTSAMESNGYVTPVGGSRIKADKGDCYICDANRHLYMWDGSVWVDLGEFQGEPGKSSYVHIAYATSITFSGSTVSAVTGFTVDNAGIDYDWWGFCTDNSETDPGRGASSTDVTAARKYKWNYMKGKDGNGTEYIYLLTKEGFTPTINQTSGQGTPSADEFLPAVANYTAGKIYGNSQYWCDDPPASVSADWPMLWWAKRDYVYNSGTGKSAWGNFGLVTLHNRYSKDGTSPWIADLDNEMDSIACDVNGHPTASTVVQTNLSFFYGSTKKSFKITGVTINGSASKTGVTLNYPTTAGNALTFKATYATTATISGKDDFAITLQPVDATSETRVLHFTINGVRPGTNGQPATLYRLVPSCSEIVKKKSGGTEPSGNVTCSVTKSTGNGAPQTITTGFTLNTYLNGSSTAYGSSTVPASSVTSKIVYELLVSGVIVDRETIPVVSDGEDGDDGNDGKYYVEEFARGSSRTNYAPQYIDSSPGNSPIDGTPGWRPTAPSATTTYPYIWMRSCLYDPNTGTYDSWSYVCQTGKDGEPGAKGDTGRMFYLAGEWQDDVAYERNADICPIVEWNNNYWYLIKDYSYNDEPSGYSTYWEVAPNFGVILTEALFTEFAKLGSFIIAGDYFISQFGTLVTNSHTQDIRNKPLAGRFWKTDSYGNISYVTTASSGYKMAYLYFNSSDPMATGSLADGVMRFRPSLVINALTGEMFLAKGNVHFTTDGDVDVAGTIRAKLSYNPTVKITGSNGSTYNLLTNTNYVSSTFVLEISTGIAYLNLPSAITYDGLEFCFFHPKMTSANVGAFGFKYNVSGSKCYIKNSQDFYTEISSTYTVPKNELLRVRAVGGNWFVIE